MKIAIPYTLLVIVCIGSGVLFMKTLKYRTDFHAQHALLVQAKDAMDQRDAQIAELKAFIALKTLPLKVSHRNPGFPTGGVLAIENKGDAPINLALSIQRGEQIKRIEQTVNPNVLVEIGQPQGWSFTSGDTVEIKADGYHAMHLKFP